MDEPRGVVRFIAEGGPSVGMGHLARSSALACALRLRGFGIDAVCLGLDGGLSVDGIEWNPGRDRPQPAILTVVDGYGITAARARIGEEGGCVVSMHRPRPESPQPSLFLDVSGDEREGALAGLRFACLRRPFWQATARELPDRVDRILVAGGGGEAGTAVDPIARGLLAALPGVRVAALRGPFADIGASTPYELVEPQADLAAELRAADLVVTAAGQTLLEAMATGAPTVAFVAAENQEEQAAAVERAGGALIAPRDQLPQAAAELARGPAVRRRLGARASALIDGLGAHRVAAAFLREAGLSGRRIPGFGGLILRSANEGDAEALRALRNDPSVRAVSRSTGTVGEEEHHAWLREAIASPDRFLFVLEREGERAPLGQVRLDRLGPAEQEISVAVVPPARGRGIGLDAVRSATALALAELGAERVKASVWRSNETSLRLFEEAGYHEEPGTSQAGSDWRDLYCERRTFAWPP